MLSPIQELKIQAKKQLKHDSSNPELITLAKGEPIKLRHCQLLIARKYGFSHWDHAKAVLEGQSCKNQGTFWYKNQCATLLNHWCKTHDEARQVQQQNGGTILPYKTQFMVVDKPFLTLIGVTQEEPEWLELNHDWCIGDTTHRQALALKRIQNW